MKKLLLFFISCLLLGFNCMAQEGMWMLTQIDDLNLKSKGLEIPVEKIYSHDKTCLANAILELGGGSASFVSPEGLVVTNHHVAFSALQRASSIDANFLENGFLASSMEEEIQAPGYEARMMTDLEDVTDEILEAVKGIDDPVDREKMTNQKINEMTTAVGDQADDMEVVVVPIYNGKQYIKYTYKVFKDIRIVYAPPSSIGNYGGEIDNWMWPRHTGDFSFMRVYVSKDGTGAEYSEDNIPYKPEIWLKVAEGDLDDGDFNFIIGYPGFTTRYRTSTSVDWNQNINYPFVIKQFSEIINLADEMTAGDPEGELKVADLVKGLANVKKNYEGKVEGMERTNFLQSKLDFEKEFLNWANSDPERKNIYGDILAKEKEQYDIIAKTSTKDNILTYFPDLSGNMLSVANNIYTITKELEKPEDERQPGLDEEIFDRLKMQLTFTYNNYYEPFDKALLLRSLKIISELPDSQRIESVDKLLAESGLSLEEWVDRAYETTKLKDLGYAESLMGKSSAELVVTDDPFLALAAALYPETEEYQKRMEAFSANVIAYRKIYMDGIYEWKGITMYPDANRTIRFTWGPVKGYEPADAVWYKPFTTLQGVLDKDTGESPFDAPEKLVELKMTGDLGRWVDPDLNDVPVDFLNQCDITGGNSGSPVLNSKGEIIGVAFDGNYEAMISDWQYDYKLQRCIVVDMRYVLFITEKFGNAGFLLKEMGVK